MRKEGTRSDRPAEVAGAGLKRIVLYVLTLASIAGIALTVNRHARNASVQSMSGVATGKVAIPYWSRVANTTPSDTSTTDPSGKPSDAFSTAEAANSLAGAIEYRDGKPFRLDGIEIFAWEKSGPGRGLVTSDHLRCVKLAKILGVRPIFLTLANNISIEWPNVKQASISCRADGNSVEFDLNGTTEIPDATVGLSTLAHGMFGVSARKIAVAATRCFQLQGARSDSAEPDYDFVKAAGDAYVSCRVTAGDTKLNVRSARSWIVRAHLERERRKRAEKDLKKTE